MNDAAGKPGQPGKAARGTTGGAGGAGGEGGGGRETGGPGGTGGAGGEAGGERLPVVIADPGPLGRYIWTVAFLLAVIAGELALVIAKL